MKLDITKILGFDLETAPLPDFSESHPAFDCWENKCRKENLDIPQLIEKFNKEAGLYAEYSSIVCLSAGYVHEGKLILRSFTGTEQEIIDNFLAALDKFIGNRGKSVQFLGHNIQNFDIPYLRKAYSRYHPMFEFPECLTDLFKKPWENSNFDTLQIHKGNNFMFSSMAEVAMMLGLKNPKIDTDGSQVAELFRKGEIDRISEYCKNDVRTTWDILMKWTGNPLLELWEGEKAKEEKVPPLKTLLNGGELNVKEKAALAKKIKAIKKKADKENLELIKGTLKVVNQNAEI